MFVEKYYSYKEKIIVNLDIDLVHLPCSLVSIDIEDVLQSHTQEIKGKILKYPLDSSLKISGEEKKYSALDNDENMNEVEYEKIKKQIKKGEGCKLKGFMEIDAVPGSFSFSSSTYGHTMQKLAQEGFLKNNEINLDHVINHLMFGHFEHPEYIQKHFSKELSKLSVSLDGHKKIKKEKEPQVYVYYLKIVPCSFADVKRFYSTYQYTYNSNKSSALVELPSIYFKYDISPINVTYRKIKISFTSFFINICAILGGVITVAGIFDAIIHKSVLLLLRKAEMNKIA